MEKNKKKTTKKAKKKFVQPGKKSFHGIRVCPARFPKKKKEKKRPQWNYIKAKKKVNKEAERNEKKSLSKSERKSFEEKSAKNKIFTSKERKKVIKLRNFL